MGRRDVGAYHIEWAGAGSRLVESANVLDGRLSDLQPRMQPLAELASEHITAQLQEFVEGGARAVRVCGESEADERKRLLEQLSVLDRILALVPAATAAEKACTAALEGDQGALPRRIPATG